MTNKDAMCKLNDSLRRNIFNPDKYGTVIITAGVKKLPFLERVELFNLVRNFNNFTFNNDPYNEHDFGKISLRNVNYFFKIDYYDQNNGCTLSNNRVLTIMRADEY